MENVHTLVLSADYRPVARVGWQRAITLLFEGKAEIVEEYEDRVVRSVTITMKVPSIIRFLRMIRRKRPAVKFSRTNIHLRDRGCCQYCGHKVPLADFTYDHVTPRSQGGTTSWTNVVVACTPCNQKKGGRTPQQAGMTLRAVPVKPTALPSMYRLTFVIPKDAPPSWRQFIASYHYWNDELEA